MIPHTGHNGVGSSKFKKAQRRVEDGIFDGATRQAIKDCEKILGKR